MSKYTLELYYFESCPYCQYVLEHAEHLGIALKLKNIHENKACFDQLVKDTGRSTVPCLYINGRPMFESRDIVKWLEQHRHEL